MRKTQWSLGAKLAMLGAPFLVLVVISTTAMLWMSWQLDGGAAAVNEAGRMRMQAYRMALSANLGAQDDLPDQIDAFGRSMSRVCCVCPFGQGVSRRACLPAASVQR